MVAPFALLRPEYSDEQNGQSQITAICNVKKREKIRKLPKNAAKVKARKKEEANYRKRRKKSSKKKRSPTTTAMAVAMAKPTKQIGHRPQYRFRRDQNSSNSKVSQ